MRANFLLLVSCILCANVMAQAVPGNNKYNFNDLKADIDLRSSFGPIRDSGDMGFCAHHAAADMLSFWLKKYAGIDTTQPANMVSGLGVALAYNNEARAILSDLEKKHTTPEKALAEAKNDVDVLKGKLFEATTNKKNTAKLSKELNKAENKYLIIYSLTVLNVKDGAFNGAEPEGGALTAPEKICFEKDVPSLPASLKAKYVDDPCGNNIPLKELFNALKGLKTDPKDKDAVAKDIRSLFPKIREKYIKKQIDKYSKKDNYDVLQRLIDKSCKSLDDILVKNRPVPVEPIESDKFDPIKIAVLFDYIDEKLEAGEPIFISYKVDFYFPADSVDKSAQLQSHASTVVGRVYDDQTGEFAYIIRNVWGPDSCECHQKYYILSLASFENDLAVYYYSNPVINQSKPYSDPIFTELYAANKEKYNSKVPFKCDKGYYLVKKSVLGKYLLDVDYYVTDLSNGGLKK